MYKFEKLIVWQESMKLAELAYALAIVLPSFEKSGLSDQLRRAAISIALNIAEGSGSATDKEFLRYLYIAKKSLFEVITIIKFIERVYKNQNLEVIYSQSTIVSKLLSKFIIKLNG